MGGRNSTSHSTTIYEANYSDLATKINQKCWENEELIRKLNAKITHEYSALQRKQAQYDTESVRLEQKSCLVKMIMDDLTDIMTKDLGHASAASQVILKCPAFTPQEKIEEFLKIQPVKLPTRTQIFEYVEM